MTLRADEIRPHEHLAAQEAAFARDVARLRERAAEFVSVACPACGADEPGPGLAKDGFTWPRCGRCATLYMSPRPTPAVMDEYYATSENYRVWATAIFPASEEARREKLHRPRLARLLELCAEWGVRPGTLLEVGPGAGSFASLAAGCDAVGRVIVVEPNPDLADACRARGLEVVQEPVERAAERLPRVDVAVAFEVIEHLLDPGRFLADCAALLRPGGLLVLSCPAASGFDIATLGAASTAVDPEHVNLFTAGSLSTALGRAGLEVLATATPGRLDAELVREAALAGRLDLDGQPFLRRVLLDGWDELGAPFQRFLAENGLSSHLWVVARR